ncbi:MAG: tripeptide aminopeptidase PepT, partial [Erysipelotrichaceae bacterium]|nr:tripeptide aminopeptidase PepT [Erysipelotrichaceae bacterium]
GTEHFNYDLFKVDFAYTLDGGDPEAVEYENFNAASAVVDFKGISVHPGSAKDKMVNAVKLAYEFNSLLDQDMVPEKTEGYEGFNHMMSVKGDVLNSESEYILRNHDLGKLEDQKNQFINAEKIMNEKYGYKCVSLKLEDSYRNMKEKFIGHMEPIELVKKSMEELGMNYKEEAIRGGTDGAALTWNGILCPNLGTGGQNYHGVHELWCKEDGEKMVDLVLKILENAIK